MPYILGGILLEKVADHPDKSAEEQPEQRFLRHHNLSPQRERAAAVKQGKVTACIMPFSSPMC